MTEKQGDPRYPAIFQRGYEGDTTVRPRPAARVADKPPVALPKVAAAPPHAAALPAAVETVPDAPAQVLQPVEPVSSARNPFLVTAWLVSIGLTAGGGLGIRWATL